MNFLPGINRLTCEILDLLRAERLRFRYFRLFSIGFTLPSISSCISPDLM